MRFPYLPDDVWHAMLPEDQEAWLRKRDAAEKSGRPMTATLHELPTRDREKRQPGIIIANANTIKPEPIDWLWNEFLARGMLHIFAGAPSTGKTTLGLEYAATISAGSYWPDGTKARAGSVLFWTGEDDISRTIVPRLTRMGANLANIGIIKGDRDSQGNKRPFNPATDMPALTAKAKEIGGVVLLIIDPVVAAIPFGKNSHNNAETRAGLQPVVDFAEAANCAVIGITHFTKSTSGKDPVERVTGSLAFGALPRIVMCAAKNLQDGPSRIFVRAKSNIGPNEGGFGYEIEPGPMSHDHPDIVVIKVKWLDALEGSARTLLTDAEDITGEPKDRKIVQAKRFLTDFLANSERPQSEIATSAASNGISERTLSRASESGIVSKRKDGKSGKWFWSLS